MREAPDSAVLNTAALQPTPFGARPGEASAVHLRQLAQTGAEMAGHQQACSESFAQRLRLALFRALAAWPH